MGHQSLRFAAVCTATLIMGCNASVDLPDEPATPAASSESTPAAESTPAEVEPPKERVAADKPVNRDPGTGYLGAVASGYRHARENIEDIPTKQAIEFFKASEGRYPKSHEEFMQKVVRANQMRLPEIEEGFKYAYDPETHSLWKVPVEEEVASQE